MAPEFRASEGRLARYAIRSEEGAERRHPEPPDPLRDPFAVDRRRIIHCAAFRRLEHKTQVFAPALHDHFRTRLTHTLEVVEIARCLAAALRLNESLVEAVTLAHDLGHPPFGHAGEVALNEAMKDHGGFNHNTHTLHVVEYLEHPFPEFRGLNLTIETLAGLRAHETSYDVPANGPLRPSLEAQVASIADRVAYNCHDLEDAIGADLIDLRDLRDLTLWREASGGLTINNIHAVRRVVLNRMLDAILEDVAGAAAKRLTAHEPASPAHGGEGPLVSPTGEMESRLVELEQFLSRNVYDKPAVRHADADGQRKALHLFEAYRRDPASLPPRFRDRIDDQGLHRVICDYIAGMTDRFCTAEHERLSST